MTIIHESQEDRDRELAEYSGRSMAQIRPLRIGAPESLRIHTDEETPTRPLSHLYQSYELMDPIHYLRTLAAYTVSRRATYLAQVENHRSLEGLHVLDFGSGVGTHGIHCLEKGATVHFLDIAGPLRAYAEFRCRRRGFGAPQAVFCGPEWWFSRPPERPYDVVLCLDVLEHVEHPVKSLMGITDAMGPGSLLALEVSTMIKPSSGHFRESIRRWRAAGPIYVAANFRHLWGVCHEKRREIT